MLAVQELNKNNHLQLKKKLVNYSPLPTTENSSIPDIYEATMKSQ